MSAYRRVQPPSEVIAQIVKVTKRKMALVREKLRSTLPSLPDKEHGSYVLKIDTNNPATTEVLVRDVPIDLFPDPLRAYEYLRDIMREGEAVPHDREQPFELRTNARAELSPEMAEALCVAAVEAFRKKSMCLKRTAAAILMISFISSLNDTERGFEIFSSALKRFESDARNFQRFIAAFLFLCLYLHPENVDPEKEPFIARYQDIMDSLVVKPRSAPKDPLSEKFRHFRDTALSVCCEEVVLALSLAKIRMSPLLARSAVPVFIIRARAELLASGSSASRDLLNLAIAEMRHLYFTAYEIDYFILDPLKLLTVEHFRTSVQNVPPAELRSLIAITALPENIWSKKVAELGLHQVVAPVAPPLEDGASAEPPRKRSRLSA